MRRQYPCRIYRRIKMSSASTTGMKDLRFRRQEGVPSSTPASAARKTSRSQQPSTSSDRRIIDLPSVPSCETCNLKPLFQVGDEVYAAWWDPKLEIKNGKNSRWFPGKVKSSRIGRHRVGSGSRSPYGPTRLYHIGDDDGDELETLQDY